MEFSNIRLIATDMDGTLLNSAGELSGEFFTLFEQIRAHDVLFAVASGRQFYNLKGLFSDIFEELIFISDNGGYVAEHGKERLIQPMSHDTVHKLIHESRHLNNAIPVLTGENSGYIESKYPELVSHLEPYFSRLNVVDNLLDVTDDPLIKLSICDLDDIFTNSYAHYQPWEDQLNVKISGERWLDITHRNANKGFALEFIQRERGISPDQTMVFGDNFNDMEMIQSAGHSFAMANAQPALKKEARYIARSNDEGGVLEVLRQVVADLEKAGS